MYAFFAERVRTDDLALLVNDPGDVLASIFREWVRWKTLPEVVQLIQNRVVLLLECIGEPKKRT